MHSIHTLQSQPHAQALASKRKTQTPTKKPDSKQPAAAKSKNAVVSSLHNPSFP
jgi:hypothetical protein